MNSEVRIAARLGADQDVTIALTDDGRGRRSGEDIAVAAIDLNDEKGAFGQTGRARRQEAKIRPMRLPRAGTHRVKSDKKNPPEAEIRAGSLRGKTRRLVQGHRERMLPPDSATH